jgi:hypothetical protein
MSKKYILPPSLKPSFLEDPVLAQIKEQGEAQKMPEVAFYQAALLAILEQRNYFMVETFRYAQQYGQLPPLDNSGTEAAATEEATPQEEEKKDFPPLRSVPAEEANNPIRFRKSYGE